MNKLINITWQFNSFIRYEYLFFCSYYLQIMVAKLQYYFHILMFKKYRKMCKRLVFFIKFAG